MLSFEERIDAGLRAAFNATPDGAVDLSDIARARRGLAEMAASAPEYVFPPVIDVVDHHIGLDDGHELWLRQYSPTTPDSARTPADSRGALYYMHGGGMVLFDLTTSDALCATIARNLDVVVVSVDYRIAPEHPHPTPVEDCYAGLEWLFGIAEKIGVDPSRIAIGGASAGAGLAAGLALLARDRGQLTPCFQMLTYPMIDDTNTTHSSHYVTSGRVWNREANIIGWDAYLGGSAGGDDVSIYASPSRASDLAGLPATIITVGDLDLFLDEDVEFAQRLMAAGVPTELHVYPGAYHGCQRGSPGSALVRRWRHDEFSALANAIADPTNTDSAHD